MLNISIEKPLETAFSLKDAVARCVRTVRARAGLKSTSRYLDAAWYRDTIVGMPPPVATLLRYFEESSGQKGRRSHPLFDAEWYKETYMANDFSGLDAIDHYIRVGAALGNNPSPLFWSNWYSKKYLFDLVDEPTLDPFRHYLNEGWKLGFDPNPLFDSRWYRQTARLTRFIDSLSHYIYYGHRHYDPHPLFNTAYFSSQLPETVSIGEGNALTLYLSRRCEANPCPLFDDDFYRQGLAKEHRESLDIVAYPPLVHYMEYGMRLDVDPHPMFSVKYYYEHAKDVKKAGIPALFHYLNIGRFEDRPTHPLFDGAFYRRHYKRGPDCDPLSEYVTEGWREKRRPRPIPPPDQTTQVQPSGRVVVYIPDDKLISPDRRLPSCKVGVAAHIFYPDLTSYVLTFTNNIPPDCVLLISTDSQIKAARIEAVCRKRSRHPWIIKVLPNRGRDVAPLLLGFEDELNSCDFAVHVHTKRSTHYSGGFDRWREYLFRMNLGTEERVKNIISVLSESKIGIVAPDHFNPIRQLIQWGSNRQTLRSLLWMAGEELNDDHVLDMPSGSMFWFKPKALRKLFALGLEFYHFDPEEGQIDGTLAHAIERGFYYFCESAGYEWVVHGAAIDVEAGEVRSPIDLNKIQFSTNRLFPTARDLGLIRRCQPECMPFLVRASPVKKPRLNLLAPILETNRAYAGVSTAIDLFHAVARELGNEFDARLIATDTSPSKQYDPPAGYVYDHGLGKDVPGRRTVLDGARRASYPTFVRDNDIFLATAWWTAHNGFDVLNQQDNCFGARERRLVYFIQDYEPGFYPWSTAYGLADDTYHHPDRTIPVFNTEILRNDFVSKGFGSDGFTLAPAMNSEISASVVVDSPKEKVVLLYARPHAPRNCLSILDLLVAKLFELNREQWKSWRFLAIGEDFDHNLLQCSDQTIEVLGRLDLAQYGALLSKAALGVSLMISPHPSYPPLEMAAAGVRVLTNDYGAKRLSELHDNIVSVDSFDLDHMATTLCGMAEQWGHDPQAGWRGRPKVDWFFDGQTNMATLARSLAQRLRDLIGPA